MKQVLAPVVAGVAVALIAILVLAEAARNTSAAPALDSQEQALVTLINTYRVQNGRSPLVMDSDLNEAADWMSNDMGVNDYYGHIDSLGREPTERICSFGYCYDTWIGENIAAGFTTAIEVFNAWKISPPNNTDMLGAAYKVMGIARVEVPGSTYGWYWTNDFAGYIAPALTATPSPPPPPIRTPTPQPTQLLTASPTPSPSPTAPPTTLPTASPTRSPSPSPTDTPTAAATPRPTLSPTQTPTATPTGVPTTPSEQQVAWGDHNCSSTVDSGDALMTLRFDAGLPPEANECPEMGAGIEVANASAHIWGDLDCSGSANSIDALKVLRFDAGLSVERAPSCPDPGAALWVQ